MGEMDQFKVPVGSICVPFLMAAAVVSGGGDSEHLPSLRLHCHTLASFLGASPHPRGHLSPQGT